MLTISKIFRPAITSQFRQVIPSATFSSVTRSEPTKPEQCKEIAKLLFEDKIHKAFLNPALLKFDQVERLIQKMIDRYCNYYEQRSASQDRSAKINRAQITSAIETTTPVIQDRGIKV